MFGVKKTMGRRRRFPHEGPAVSRIRSWRVSAVFVLALTGPVHGRTSFARRTCWYVVGPGEIGKRIAATVGGMGRWIARVRVMESLRGVSGKRVRLPVGLGRRGIGAQSI